MKLHCLGSSSAGNGYILEGNTSALIIEAGVPLMEVKKALNFDMSKIAGVIISHSHGDHSGKVKEYEGKGFEVFKNFNEGQFIICDQFKIRPFPVIHDVPCHGFLIDHPESGKIVFLTDTQYSPFRFNGVSHWLIEANFDQEILDEHVLNGRIQPFVRQRIMNSHMSLQTTKELLKANDLSKSRNIVLIHLSSGNAHAEKFKSEIEGLTGIQTTIADKGLVMDLSLNAF